MYINISTKTDFTYTVDFMYLLRTVQQESLAGGKFGECGESSVIRQTKTIQISTYN